MSQNVKHELKTIVVPYVGIERIIEILQTMYKNNMKEQSLENIAKSLECGLSNLNNVTPTLTILGLGEVRKGILKLTPDGLVCADAFLHNDHEKAKVVFKKNIEKSEALLFTKSLLEIRSTISGDEIGNALSDRFNKDWKSLQTIRNFGNSCASIIAFAGFGYYGEGILSNKPPTIKVTSSFYSPSIGYNPMMNLLKSLHGFERVNIKDIIKKLQANEATLYTDLTICTILNLVEKETAKTYKLTDNGRQLIDPTISEENKTRLFRKCLLSSQYGEIIKKLAESKQGRNYSEIGSVLSFFMKKDWSEKSTLPFVKKFLTWLNNAGLTEKIKPGIYKIIIDDDEQLETTNKTLEEQYVENPVKLKSVYEIGRSIGALESIMLDVDKTEFFNEKLAILKGLLEEHEDIKMTLDMLGNNFQVATDTKNPTVYQSNVDFVRNKVKEKIFGGNKV